MTALVLDASVTMAWCFEESKSPFTDAALDAVRDDRAVVPALWALEVANALAVAERRGLVSSDKMRRFLDLLTTLPTEIHHHEPRSAFGDVLSLARAHKLSSYDAAYLELSRRSGLPLATLDASLRAAAKKASARLFSA